MDKIKEKFLEDAIRQYKEKPFKTEPFNFVTSQHPPPWEITEDDMRPYKLGETREWRGDTWCYTQRGWIKR